MWAEVSMRITGGANWGSRAALGATVRELQDVLGNRDGIWGNEAETAGTTGSALERNPLIAKIRAFADVGLSATDERRLLSDFRAEKEAGWGRPVTDLNLDRLGAGELFAAQKAIALERYGRTPADVTEGFVRAEGSVCGEPIAARELFVQRWRPMGEPSGKVVVLSPGFQETGRHFYEQIDRLSRAGHDVVVLDHQWAGLSEGSPGGLDRGFGVARDVAAVLSHASEVVRSDYGDVEGAEVIAVGNSMGGGPGVLGALTLLDNDMIDLGGAPLPKIEKAALQAPFLEATGNWMNDALGLASKLPFVNRLALPSAGLPQLNTDAEGAQQDAQHMVLEDVRAQLGTMSAANEDLARIVELIAEGKGPRASLYVVHGDDDPLADSAKSVWLKETLGDRVELDIIDSDNHVMENNPGEQEHLLRGIARLVEE
jgi:alpha-beta hydrolase superfamily lysophospholipase